MKTLLFTMLLALSCCSAVAQTDEVAIRQIIESESRDYHLDPDRKVFTTYWHLTADTRLVLTDPTGTYAYSGKDLQAFVDKGEMPPANNAVSEYSNFVVKAGGTIGWATFDQKSTVPDGKSSYTREFRCVEKINGIWKIVSSSVHNYNP